MISTFNEKATITDFPYKVVRLAIEGLYDKESLKKKITCSEIAMDVYAFADKYDIKNLQVN